MIMRPQKQLSGLTKLKHKKRLYQLNRVEVLFKLMDKKNVDIAEVLKLSNNSASFKFYESHDILLHKKIGDIK